MEKWKLLIRQVQEQSEADTDPARLLVTVQLLQEELVRVTNGEPVIKERSSITVMLPGFRRKPDTSDIWAEEYLPKASADAGPLTGAGASERPADTGPLNEAREADASKEAGNTGSSGEAKYPGLSKQPADIRSSGETGNTGSSQNAEDADASKATGAALEEPGPPREVWRLDPVLETPTLAHQDEIKELNELMGRLNGESLNDQLKLRLVRDEIATFLTETPVRDLKKAIGINDRFLFVNELFRGDEDMYERSLKTINNFRILAEAEYWIERELKIKLGWDTGSETAREFYKLVRRRFS